MMASAILRKPSCAFSRVGLLFCLGGVVLVALIGLLQKSLDDRRDRVQVRIQELSQLPRGDYLKPALLGFHHLGADVLWLKLVQVLGNKRNSADEYEWMAHALEVITTLDPQYGDAYYTGGVILGDLAHRADLANRLLGRGAEANPNDWRLPFLLGYNHYFLMGDSSKGAEYLMRAASLPGHPAYLSGLATRLAAEAGNPITALAFLEARLRETQDQQMREFFMARMKEVMIERDVQLLDRSVESYQEIHGTLPATLEALVHARILAAIPAEPFGGEYLLDLKTGRVSSSTHPKRLRTFTMFNEAAPSLLPKVEPAYVFPHIWE